MDAAPQLSPLRRRLAAKFPPPSRYFRWVGDLAPCRVVIYARESSRWQDVDGNLKYQIALLRRLLRKMGFTVIKVFGEAASGQRYERPLLERAAAYARRHNAILVAEAVNRLVRSPLYHTQRFPVCPLHDDEMERIVAITGGVNLATYLHPDATHAQVHEFQTNRGLRERARANRPAGYKKVRRDNLAPRAIVLSDLGYSIREVGGILKVHPATIARWLKRRNETPGNDSQQ